METPFQSIGRFRERGRLAPDRLQYVSSWVDGKTRTLLSTHGNRRAEIAGQMDRELERHRRFRRLSCVAIANSRRTGVFATEIVRYAGGGRRNFPEN